MAENMQQGSIVVAVAILIRDENVLLSRRRAGSHLEGLWEFPGGKVEPDESPTDAVRREVEEEVGLAVERAHPFHRLEFEYPERRIDLHFFLVTDFTGEMAAREGQEAEWVALENLDQHPMPAANSAVVAMLRDQRHR